MSLSKTGHFSDSGHWEQTRKTFYFGFHTLGFWGHGYGKTYNMYLKGQSSVIHNVYAATWTLHGIYMLFFYLFIISIVLFSLIKLFLFEKINNDKHFILKMSICVFLFMLFGVWVTNPLIMAEKIKMQIIWFTLLSLIIRLSPQNISILLPRSYMKLKK